LDGGGSGYQTNSSFSITNVIPGVEYAVVLVLFDNGSKSHLTVGPWTTVTSQGTSIGGNPTSGTIYIGGGSPGVRWWDTTTQADEFFG
jgi:hypothetical protein